MKKLPVLFYSLLCIAAVSCNYNDKDVNITYHDSGQYYSMEAYYSKSKTRDVEKYMDKKIGERSHMSFVNSQIDGSLTLDDHTRLYIKKSPGILEIKLDKDKNSDQAYHNIRSMCQGIKKVIAE